MDHQSLKEKLTAGPNAAITISESTLTRGIGDFLIATCDGQPIVISDVKPEPTSDPEALQISGRSSFLNVPDLPVSALFTLDEHGEVHAVLRYQLRDENPGPNAWTFSRSFPGLPVVVDYDSEVPAGVPLQAFDMYKSQRPFLDALYLFNTWFVVSTHPCKDPVSGVELEAGINFVSAMRPMGMIGVLEILLGGDAHLTLHGTIHLPKAGDKTLPLQPLEVVWARETAPGIHLQASLGVSCKLGGAAFNEARFRVYSPPSSAWMAQNNSFLPMHGYTGKLTIPSAGIEIDLGADLQWNVPEAFLYGDCKGVTLGKLTHLLDLTGNGSLSSHLPKELEKAVDALDKLALLRVALDLGVSGVAPSVGSLEITVGIPDLKWRVWDDHLVVDDIACRFTIEDPFATSAALSAGALTAPSSGASRLPPVSVMVVGTLDVEGLPLSVYASNEDGFSVRAVTRGAINLPLDKLLRTHAPGVASPTPLTINNLSVAVAPGWGYGMCALLAGEPKPWVIPVGREALTVSDVVLDFQYPVGGPLAGSFAGKIDFADDILLSVSCDLSGNVTARSVVPRVNVGKLIEKLCDHEIPLPSGFDLVLENASILVQKLGQDFVFQAGAGVKDFGLFAFEAQKTGGAWGFAYGMDLAAGKPCDVPGLSALQKLEDAIHLRKLMLVVSSIDNVSFQFPDAAQFSNPSLPTGSLRMPPQATGLAAGVNFYGEWELDEHDATQKAIKSLLGLSGTLGVTLAIDPAPGGACKLFVHQSGKLFGHPFSYELGAMVTFAAAVIPVPGWFLSGSVTVPIQGHQVTFDVTTVFTLLGMYISGDMKGSTPIDFKLFKLSNLAFQLCVDILGLPSMGLAGTIDVKTFESSIAVFPNSVDPLKSLVAGSVSALSLEDVVNTLSGGLIPKELDGFLHLVSVKGTHQFKIPAALADDLSRLSLDGVAAAFKSAGDVEIPSNASQILVVANRKGEAWHLTDLTRMRHYQLKKQSDHIEVSIEPQFYFSPLPTFIGTISFPAATYVNGALEFFGFHATATIDIQPFQGVSIDVQMSKIVLIDDEIFSIEEEKGKGGPRVSVSTFSQPKQPVPEFRPPHFYVNGHVQLLGIHEAVYASAGPHGLTFDLKGTLLPGVYFELSARFDSGGFEGGGKIKIGIGSVDLGQLGKIKINTDVEGTLDIKIADNKVTVTADASFQFMGDMMTLGKFDVDTSDKTLARLPEKVAHQIEKRLGDAFKDVDRWTNAFKSGLVEGVAEPAKVLEHVYGKTAKDAEKLGKDLGKGTEEAAKQTEHVAKEVGKETEHAVKAVSKLFH
jgi:hypothetical protein